MQNPIKHIPNLMTIGNLISGCLAILIATNYIQTAHIYYALSVIVYLVIICLVLDFMDGLIARKLSFQSPLGAQLDSLADMVSFGVLPGILMVVTLSYLLQFIVIDSYYFKVLWGLLGLLIPAFAAYRLAVFNIDAEQSDYFKGLPTPALTIYILAACFTAIEWQKKGVDAVYLVSGLSILGLIGCIWMIIKTPMMSLKFKNLDINQNHYRYVYLLICLVLSILLGTTGILLSIVLYGIWSIIFKNYILYGNA